MKKNKAKSSKFRVQEQPKYSPRSREQFASKKNNSQANYQSRRHKPYQASEGEHFSRGFEHQSQMRRRFSDAGASSHFSPHARTTNEGHFANSRPRFAVNQAWQKAKLEIRLHKYLADLGYGSRREIEEKIRTGRVKIQGRVASIGEKIQGNERITIDSKPVLRPSRHLQSAPAKVLLYHKPVGEICSRKDPENRPTVFDKLPRLRGKRWIAIGRLDFNTSGLLLFTDDGDLANRLMHPSSQIEREYWVRVQGKVSEETIKQLLTGVELEDGRAKFSRLEPLRNISEFELEEIGQKNRYFSVSLCEGKNREVRRLWEAVDCQVSRLKRTKFAGITLPRSLPVGRFRLATRQELALLKDQLKKSQAKQARYKYDR